MGLQSHKRQNVAGSIAYAELAPFTGDFTADSSSVVTLAEGIQRTANATIATAAVLALNATPITILASPGAAKASILLGIVIHKPAGTAYAGIHADENLAIKYTDGSGLLLATVETAGFLDQSTAQTRYVYPTTAADLTPVADAVIVAQLLVGEIITGTSALKFRVYYRVVPTVL